jgi:hypothetical protein
LQLTVETPDNESDTLPVTVIADVETVAPFPGDVMLSTGGVLSMLSATDADAVFPATSVAVPGICWLEPSVDTVTGDGQLATPDSASLHAKVTVTLELFQSAAFGAGDADALMFGGVLSRLIVTDAEAVFPAMSVAVPEIT